VGEEEGILCVAVLATKLIHLPDEPAGVGQIRTQTVEVLRAQLGMPSRPRGTGRREAAGNPGACLPIGLDLGPYNASGATADG
jgi:hypothetical protein